jgi:hypothetical protein
MSAGCGMEQKTATAMERCTSPAERACVFIGWRTNSPLGQFPKGYRLTTYAVLGFVSIHHILRQSPAVQTRCAGTGHLPNKPGKPTACEVIPST